MKGCPVDEDFSDALNALGKQVVGTRLVEAVVDSGVVDSVAPPGVSDGPARPSAMSKSGGKHRSPDG